MFRGSGKPPQPALRVETDGGLERVHWLSQASAALLHDVVLDELTLIASAVEGPISSHTRWRIERARSALRGEDLPGGFSGDSLAPPAALPLGQVAAAVAEARAAGLTVDVSGEPGMLARLDRDVELALGMSIGECLKNVRRHSGVRLAEVVVFLVADRLSVMVIDAGCGFDETALPADRLGIRGSVRARIEAVGGSVQIWSAAGRGTSAVMQVPAGSATDAVPPASTVVARSDSAAALPASDRYSVGVEVLDGQVLPLLSAILDRGAITATDAVVAARLARSIRGLMVAEVERGSLLSPPQSDPPHDAESSSYRTARFLHDSR